MRWLFNFFDRRVTAQYRKELEGFLSLLRSMTDDEMAELVTFVTHMRHGFEQAGNNVLDPLTLWIKKPEALPEIIRLIQSFQSKNNHSAATALMVWCHSIRAASRGGLLPLGQEMWLQLSRGFSGVEAAKDKLQKRTGLKIDVSDANIIPLGLATAL